MARKVYYLQVQTIFAFLVSVLITVSRGLTNDDNLRPIINTDKGRVRGVRTFITNQQIPVDKFLGIPYAEPPVGQGRFRRPIEAHAWDDVKDTTDNPPACYQKFQTYGFRGDDMWNPTVPLSEDCLYLNVWVPRNIQRPMTKLTTLVWIYGGGFYSGSSDLPLYDGSFLAATHNAIVVSMNYRMGPLGFLSLGTGDAPGNAGLMDQSLAMKWVYQNIEAFGGDRSKITLFGESAGAASVSYHLLAQPSWEYFSYAIMQSSVALSPWSFSTRDKLANVSKNYAEKIGCQNDDPQQILDCLRQKSPQELVQATPNGFKFTPTADGSFLTKSPKQLLKQKRFKKCSILLGFTVDEQTYFMSANLPEKFGRNIQGTPSVDENDIESLLPRVVTTGRTTLPKTSLAFQNLRQFYINSVPREIRGDNYKVLGDIAGDFDFKCPLINFARHYAEQDLGVYMYEFDHRSPTNPWPEWMGVMHGYEIEFVFGLPYNSSLAYTTEDKRMSDVLMSYWTTFAATGNPNTQNFGERFWPNFTTSEQKYKVLKSDLLETKEYPRYAQCSFWEDFVPVLSNFTQSTAQAFARCSGTQFYIPVFSIVLSVIASALGHSTFA